MPDYFGVLQASLIRDFISVGRPVVVRGALSSCANAMDQWSRDRFLQSDFAKVWPLGIVYLRARLKSLALAFSRVGANALSSLQPKWIRVGGEHS